MSKQKKNQPNWRTISIQPHYTGKLKELEKLSRNIWWSWNVNAVELFKYINDDKTISECIDPISMLKNVSQERFSKLEIDNTFLKKFKEVITDFSNYINKPFDKDLPSVAYFSMEYGLANVLHIYSGGLGILAGDYLKQASDSGFDMVAIGLFYRQGYFKQIISKNGDQDEIYESHRFMETPAELVKDNKGEAITVSVEMEGRKVYAQIWQLNVGRIRLFLLDTDRNDNSDEDKAITYRLYGGNNENRLRQEMILGIGGVKTLRLLGINQSIYHLNEGHAAFAGIERLKNYILDEKLTFNEALEVVRASSLYTTHTPVPAGHDAFSENIMMQYMGDYPNRLGIKWEKFIKLGKENPENKDEKFSMSILAANTCLEINGVSKLHGEVSRKLIFSNFWKDYFPEELHIGYVTNGIHYPTWASKDWKELLQGDDGKPDFSKVYKVSDEEIWEIRKRCKSQLFEYINRLLDKVSISRNENPKHILKIKRTINKNVLTIGFARRFATYKRGTLLFKDIERLSKIINDSDRPVQFIFAGKAHPNDGGGQEIIKQIVEISMKPEFIGKILFLENYDISLAKELVRGVDVWLNTPVRPLEASGTSGMKAVMNGVLNFSVLDGWWVEGYKEGAGWSLSQEKTYKNQDMQNEYDAEQIYQILENEIIPLYYNKNEKNIPVEWVKYIKKCVSEIAPNFTTKRMIEDYNERYYTKIASRFNDIKAENNLSAKKISSWKENIRKEWKKMELISADTSELTGNMLVPGQTYTGKLLLNINGLKAEDIGVEFVISESNSVGELAVTKVIELEQEKSENSTVYFNIKFSPSKPGSLNYAFRIFPKNKYLAHRQDCPIVKWL